MPEKLQLNRLSAPLWTSNASLHARSRHHFVHDFPGPLSIKSVVRGSIPWKTGNRPLLVDEHSFLVLNQGEPYTLEIDSREPVETCCVFFERGFVESTYASMTSRFLNPVKASALNFVSRLHPYDERILPRLKAIAAAPVPDPLWLDEQFLLLAHDLLLAYDEASRQVARCPAARPSTRVELYKRLCRGREYLHAHLSGDARLAAIARAACVSPYHFQRAFRASFGVTPHRYLTTLRLQRAQALLAFPTPSISEVAAAVGFESSTTFSALFLREFGLRPSAYRSQKLRNFR